MKNKILIIKYLSILIFILCSTTIIIGQVRTTTVSGVIKDKDSQNVLSYVNVILKAEKDSTFVMGTISDENGRFSLLNIKPGYYYLNISYIGYSTILQPLYIGNLSDYLDVASIEMSIYNKTLNLVEVIAKQEEITEKMEKKVFTIDNNISQSGGSVLQTLQSLPGITIHEGKMQLRGNDKVTVLIDGTQTAITGFGNQSGLDNIPISAVEKIEIINNPSAKYDANGNAGIINIIYKKNKKEGFNGKLGLTTGVGALWERNKNLPDIRPQYKLTPKINPSLSLNYRKNKVNVFLQLDNLYTQTLNKNEFVERTYENGTIIKQQLKRNRNTNFFTSKAGIDWQINKNNKFSISAFYGSEKIIDRGDQPFFNVELYNRLRLWQFLEDELKTTIMTTANYQHHFNEAGHVLNISYNYTFHREDEKYFFNNIMPTFSGEDAFKLISDEQVSDFNLDYIKPLKHGRIETGFKFRKRDIPTNMNFIPGLNSPLDTNAGGWANYNEIIPALYGNYIFETKKIEIELGLRLEYVNLKYNVNPNHNTYKSDGYNYSQPFPNVRLGYKINDKNKITIFYNRRVDRPNEVDIRIFPKYDDAEIIKVGNPQLKPQFTNSIELGYKTNWKRGYFYSAAYHKFANGTINRISSITPNNTLIYAVFQNAGKSYNTGIEIVLNQELTKWYSFNFNINGYHNQIDAFTIENKYPVINKFKAEMKELYSGNLKFNNTIHLPKKINLQVSILYLLPDIIPQGKIYSRFSLDFGLKKTIQKGKGELILNATDLLNTMIIKKEIKGQGFKYTSADYYETQTVRLGYSYKF